MQWIENKQQMLDLVREIGFLPLTPSGIVGFSVFDRVDPMQARSDKESSPWEWRYAIPQEGDIAYGKFFGGKAGMISLEWLPYFMNFRRNGMSFQEEYEGGAIPYTAKAAMELVQAQGRAPSVYLRHQSGASEATIATLQMKLYLTVCGYEKRRNKYGEEYGWNISVFTTPEQLYGPTASCAEEEPEISLERAVAQCARFFPQATEKQIKKFLRF